MKVISLFDGISCGRVALDRAGFHVDQYYASEIDRSAVRIAKRNYPKTIELGDVRHVKEMVNKGIFGDIDLLMGGSPCQGFSRVGRNLGFADPRSQLLFDYISILFRVKPRYFLLENVRMNQQSRDFISALIGVQPIEIDSALVSGQRRVRLYWTNIPIQDITDKLIDVRSVLEHNTTANSPNFHRWYWRNHERLLRTQLCRIVNDHSKAITLLARHVANWQGNYVLLDTGLLRYLTPIESERLQTLPDGYTHGAALTKRYHHIGNGWTVDVIAHILRGMSHPAAHRVP